MAYDTGLHRDTRHRTAAIDHLTKPLKFGDGVGFTYDANALYIDGDVANDVVSFGSKVNTDVRFDGATATRDLLWDASANNLRFMDSSRLTFGTTDKVYAGTSGSNLAITSVAGSDVLFNGSGEVRVDGSVHFNRSPGRYYLEEFFKRKPGLNADIQNAAEATREIANPDFELLGTNAVTANSTFSTTPRAGITLTTDANANDQVILLPHLDANQSAWTQTVWLTNTSTIWECSIETGASIAACIIWLGLKLTNTPVIATDADQLFFRYEAGVDTNWNAVYSIGGVDDENDTGVAVAINSKKRFAIKIDSSRIATFYIDEVLVATSTALTDAIALIPYIGIQTTAGATKALRIHYEKISRTV